MRVKDLAVFIKTRDAHRRLKEGHKPRNFILDPIIAKYRFCNMNRNDDRVTKAIFSWAEQWYHNPDLWFVFVVARLFNNPDTLAAIAKYVLPFKPAAMGAALQARKATGERVFNPAYIVSTNGRAMDKIEYVIIHVLQPLWQVRKAMRPTASVDKRAPSSETLESWHARLQAHQGMGSFMAAQVVADLKYHPGPLAHAADWATFAASGPGSRRGLNRVMDRAPDAPWREPAWRETLSQLRAQILPLLRGTHLADITAQNLQNCLCEFDKYERARLGEQPPKQLYKPHKEN